MAEEIKKDKPEAKKEEVKTEASPDGEVGAVKKKKKSKKRSVTDGRIYVHASYNNTIITVTDVKGDTLVWTSAGASGFKGTRKATPYAAQVAAEKAMEKAKTLGLERANIFVKGTGIGRDQALRAIAGSGVHLESITDLTPLPHNGTRARKPRRV